MRDREREKHGRPPDLRSGPSRIVDPRSGSDPVDIPRLTLSSRPFAHWEGHAVLLTGTFVRGLPLISLKPPR